jgi:hypothetical protein
MLRKLRQPILMLMSASLLLVSATLSIHGQQQSSRGRARKTPQTPEQSQTSKERIAEGESPFAVEAARVKGGLVKAMLLVDANGKIVRCFNSILTGSAASTLPCGFKSSLGSSGRYIIINFGFQVDDRFILTTPVRTGNEFSLEDSHPSTATVVFNPRSNDTVFVTTSREISFMLFVF